MIWGQQTIFGTVEYDNPPQQTPTGRKKRKPTRPNGYASRPGTGPAGQTCKTCCHKHANEMRSGRRFWKCTLMQHCCTNGPGSDIKMKSPACSRWEVSTC